MKEEIACIQEIEMDSFAILIDSASQNHPNNILIYERTKHRVRNILNPNSAPEYLGLRLLPTTEENPLLLVRDRQHISVVDVTNSILVNLFSSPIDVDLMTSFYLDVIEQDGQFEIFTIEYVKGSISQVIKHTVP